MSRTVGIDLSAEPVRTAVCTVTWAPGAATVEPPIRPADDAAVLAACSIADRVGIDCPFGWPEPFLVAMAAHVEGLPWPGRDQSPGDYRRELRYRATDYYVHAATGRWPLSVSTDLIGVAAMRCASLLDALAARGSPVDRSGNGLVMEVYPAAALREWQLLRKSYKVDPEVLDAMVTELRDRLPDLRFPEGDEAYRRSDHAFDALICALVARAGQCGGTVPPQTADQQRRALTEGWIHLPSGGPPSLEHLIRGSSPVV